MSRAFVKIDGLDDIREQLKDVGVREGRNLMRATVRSVAVRIQRSAAEKAPVDEGDMKRSLKVRARRSHPDSPVFEVWAGSTGGSKFDAFYWRFVEYGTSGQTAQPARPFIRPAVEEVRALLPGILREEFGKKWEKALARKRKKASKIPGE